MSFSSYVPLDSYPANGVQTDFDISDRFYDEGDIRAVVVLAGQEFPMTNGLDFTVIVTDRDLTPPWRKAGKIRFIVPPVNGANVVPFILPPALQDQPFEQRPVTPRAHERVHDRHAMTIAMLLEFFNRSYRSTLDTPPGLRTIVAGRENYVPTWDALGNLVEGPTVGQINLIVDIVPEIDIVAGIRNQIVSVDGISAQIVTVAGISAAVATVANIAPAVPIVAAIDDEVVIVSLIATQVATVSAAAAQVVVVADNIASVTTTATNIANINLNATNIVAIQNASANALAAAESAGEAADSAAAAATSAASVDPVNLKWVSKGIGELYIVDTSLAGVDIPPTDNPNFRYIQLSAGAAYNTGVLTGETVSGSGNAMLATAVISLAGSPINGKTVRLLNAERRFVRAGVAGVIENSQNLSHSHTGTAASAGAHTHTGGFLSEANISNNGGNRNGGGPTTTGSSGAHTHVLTIAVDGGDEAHPKNISMTYYMRIA